MNPLWFSVFGGVLVMIGRCAFPEAWHAMPSVSYALVYFGAVAFGFGWGRWSR